MERPLVLVTNDDGVDSLGLWAAVEALLPLGEILVVAPDRANGPGRIGYKMIEDVRQCEPESDVWAVHVDHVVSVTPLSLNLTTRANFDLAPTRFGIAWAAGLDMPELQPFLHGRSAHDFRTQSLTGEPWLPRMAAPASQEEAFVYDPELD